MVVLLTMITVHTLKNCCACARAHVVDKLRRLSRRRPFKIKISNDGAPTSKLRGCCTLSITLCDPRLPHVRNSPQKKTMVFPIAGFFEAETKASIRAGFSDIYTALLEIERDGLEVNGVHIPIYFPFVNDMSNSGNGTGVVGGSLGTSTWFCSYCAATRVSVFRFFGSNARRRRSRGRRSARFCIKYTMACVYV